MVIEMKHLIVIWIALVSITRAVEHPSESGEKKTPLSERKFKSGKVQQVWEKAERKELSSVSLADLYIELKHHDHRLMEYKLLQSQKKPIDETLQIELDQEFHNIMFKYGMAANKKEKIHLQEEKPQKKTKEVFEDLKLNKFWNEIVANGRFNDKELESLLLEFRHHEDKMKELQELQEGHQRFQDHHENSIEKHSYDERMADKEYMEKLAKELDDSYQKLHLVTRKNKGENLPFTDPKVLDLYYKMKEGNFSEEEEQSILEELRHFEIRIDKHRHFRDQLKNAAEKMDFHGGKKKAPPVHITRHQKLTDKVREMADKMHKVFIGLKSRLGGGVIEHKQEL